ncbi:PepSY domain-containing protein [Fulvivirga sp. M361]|uniref:PepSY-associated TM helix domain-containing protein n=1 Tax=Fulvivirga sp. M361 TaxID=2594266 RepID=UPI00117A2023|nr:PepSY-associated TM helix domain-containing protein [Fulvivirga sp. M361]TRX58411.1 PepSY domain-containing protein [Fulvivirga sp. M361]
MKKNQLWALHSWVGLYAGIAIAFLSLTGAAALFRIELDALFNPDLRQVESGGQHVTMNPIVEKVKSMHPDKLLFEVELPASSESTWNIRLIAKQKDRLFPMLWEVFINPYTGEILGERNYYQTFSYYLRNLHVRFYEGFYGRQIVGLAGIALLISTITGFFIYGQFMKKQLFGTIRKKNLRIKQADLHKLIGVAALVFNLMIAITGAWLGLQVYLQKWLTIERPNTFQVKEAPFNKTKDTAYKVDFDRVYSNAKKHFPELVPKLVRPSTNGDGTISVLGNVPRQAYERNSNKIVLDKRTYAPLYTYDISHAGMGAKLFFIQESLHFGDFGGITLKFLYCLLGLTSGFLSITGFIVYLERTRKNRMELPGYTELKPLLFRYTMGIITFCVFVAILSLLWGIGIPTLFVVILFYGFVVLVLLKRIIEFVRTKWSGSNRQRI